MPLYEYECDHCKLFWDYKVPLKDADMPVECPVCKRKMVKIMSAPRFIIK